MMTSHHTSGTSASRRARVRMDSSLSSTIMLVAVGMASFFAGTLYTMHAGIDKCPTTPTGRDEHILSAQVEELAQRRVRELKAKLPDCKPTPPMDPEVERQLQKPPMEAGAGKNADGASPLSFPSTMGRFLAGATRTAKADFFDLLDLGVPIDLPKEGDSDVLILHQRAQALPSRFKEYSELIPALETKEAVENCDYVNVVLTDHSKGRNQCWAIVPQYESYHIQKWMRIPEENKLVHAGNGNFVSKDAPLRLVGRGMKTNGWDEFSPPLVRDMRQNWQLLTTYFAAFDDVLKELTPLVKKVATPQKTVTVMVCNFGQSELLVNFACAAKSRSLDTSSILVFATDVETKALAEHLGFTAFYDERNFGSMPQEAAGSYGDRKFTAMMMAKVYCVHMVSALKYNILFQDVDIVWYKDPIRFFETQHLDFDLLFQDDGGHTIRYAPYSANSGFYYVRYNARTEYFFNSLLLAGDLIQKTDSHQQALIALLSEHGSLFGLKTKVFSRDEHDFPGGYQYHQKSGQYMRDFFAGKIKPYLFHMSWTLNKDNKLLYLRQMGEWYVQDPCVHKTVPDILGAGNEQQMEITSDQQALFTSTCCAAKPLISCHYRDKPSVIPCKDSPPIDKGQPSFWK